MGWMMDGWLMDYGWMTGFMDSWNVAPPRPVLLQQLELFVGVVTSLCLGRAL
jgi:hypothetical protein